MDQILSPAIGAVLEKGVLGLVTLLALGVAYLLWGRIDKRDNEIKALNEARITEMKLALQTVNANISVLDGARREIEHARLSGEAE